MTDPCPHYCDNQGLCHRCGILMDEYLWDLYINGPPKDKTMPKPRSTRPVKKVRLYYVWIDGDTISEDDMREGGFDTEAERQAFLDGLDAGGHTSDYQVFPSRKAAKAFAKSGGE